MLERKKSEEEVWNDKTWYTNVQNFIMMNIIKLVYVAKPHKRPKSFKYLK